MLHPLNSQRLNVTTDLHAALKQKFSEKCILITGGTGSFGRQLAAKLLSEFSPKKVIIFSRDEWKQWEMRASHPLFNDERIRYFLGDIRDKERLLRSFREVDYVVHTAALKQVPAAENNPSEFVKTNILGSMNIIEAAIDCQVKEVIALSTDKAVSPANLYGATKLCSDKLFVAGNAYVGKTGIPRFSVVRYGNVLGSRGSLLELWQQILDKGAQALPITDKRMTRFWITMQQAINFVLLSFCRNHHGGEIFVPKIPSMNILDLAKAFAPDREIMMCGIREGEKIHESLISPEEARNTFEYSDHYVIAPKLFKNGTLFISDFYKKQGGISVSEEFTYSSDTNKERLSREELVKLLSSSELLRY